MSRALLAAVTAAAFLLSLSADARKRRRRRRPPKPVPVLTTDGRPNVLSQAAYVVDLDTGQELYAKNAAAVRPIASLTKLGAALAVVDHLDLDAATPITDADLDVARGGSRSRLRVGSAFSNRDLLHAALMSSDNRAVSALGRAAGWDTAALVRAMNDKAAELGLRRTRFGDPVGLSPHSVSTAREVVGLLRAAIAHPVLRAVMHTRHYVAVATAPRPYRIVYRNTNHLLGDPGLAVLGGKTGFTAPARYCFTAAVRTAAGRRIGAAVLGAEGRLTRFGDYRRVLRWLELDGRRADAPPQGRPL